MRGTWHVFLGVVAQDTSFVPMPVAIPNCPPGLEYLTQIDQLIIKQKKELFESKMWKHSCESEWVIYASYLCIL